MLHNCGWDAMTIEQALVSARQVASVPCVAVSVVRARCFRHCDKHQAAADGTAVPPKRKLCAYAGGWALHGKHGGLLEQLDRLPIREARLSSSAVGVTVAAR